jgi:hypothetical protein
MAPRQVPYPAEYRQQIVELVHAGRTPDMSSMSRIFAMAGFLACLVGFEPHTKDVNPSRLR